MAGVVVRLATWMASLLVVLSGAALVVGVGLAQDARLPWFEACALPCWGGLLPGETPFREATTVLKQNLAPDAPLTSDGVMISFRLHNADSSISGVVTYDGQDRVGAIYLKTVVPFGFLLDELGTPECLWVQQAPNSQALFLMFWKRSGQSVRAFLLADEHGRLDTDGMARALEIGDGDAACIGSGELPWLGFAPAWRYTAARKGL